MKAEPNACIDMFHEGCQHPGWQEVATGNVKLGTLGYARRGADTAARRLGLAPVIRLLFFERGPAYRLQPDPLHYSPLDHLNLAPYDGQLMGKAGPTGLTPQPTLWLRASLPPAVALWVACHESRHVWQDLTAFVGGLEEAEDDATTFAWATVEGLLAPEAIRAIAAELDWG